MRIIKGHKKSEILGVGTPTALLDPIKKAEDWGGPLDEIVLKKGETITFKLPPKFEIKR